MKSKRKDNEGKDESSSQPSAREILMKAGRKRSTSKKDEILGTESEVKRIDSDSGSDRSDSSNVRSGRNRSSTDRKSGREERSSTDRKSGREERSSTDRKSGREERSSTGRKSGREERSSTDRKSGREERSSTGRKSGGEERSSTDRKSGRAGRFATDRKTGSEDRYTDSPRGKGSRSPKSDRRGSKPDRARSISKGKKPRSTSSQVPSQRVEQDEYLREEIRLNKYIAHAGLCSRREADEYIEQGKVRVNGVVVTELGTKVKSTDNVMVEKQKLSLEPFVYILLNKGRDTISTTDDEKDRNTVVDAIEGATGHRVYPVGRLDRNTMGILILTNDGDLAHRLMHPSYKVKKTYEVTSSRKLSDEELERLRAGVTLEDGPVNPTSIQRDPVDPYVITITVFEGRNHLIRRMIGHLGADVSKLVRTRYAGLTDKNTRIGRWRFLKQKEINDLRRLVKLDALSFNKS